MVDDPNMEDDDDDSRSIALFDQCVELLLFDRDRVIWVRRVLTSCLGYFELKATLHSLISI